MRNFYVFPFDKVPKGAKIAIFGAGAVGYDYYLQLRAIDYCAVAAVADPYYKTVDQFVSVGVTVRNPDALAWRDVDFVVVATRFEAYRDEWLAYLAARNVPPEKIVARLNGLESGAKGVQFARPHYAQRAEDVLVYSLFRFIGIEKPSYIDVRAHHPYELSNTALLYEAGGRGINVEPNPDLFKNFETERPDDVNIRAGVSGRASGGALTFYMLADEFGAEAPALNGFSLDAVNEMVEKGKGGRKLHVMKTLEIEILRLNDIINDRCGGVWPQYMSMDIEGEEFEVIRHSDMTDGPIAVTIEIDKLDTPAFCGLMGEKGYAVYCRTGGNITFVRQDYAKKVIYG